MCVDLAKDEWRAALGGFAVLEHSKSALGSALVYPQEAFSGHGPNPELVDPVATRECGRPRGRRPCEPRPVVHRVRALRGRVELGRRGVFCKHVNDNGRLRRLDSDARSDKNFPDLLPPRRDWRRLHRPRFHRGKGNRHAASKPRKETRVVSESTRPRIQRWEDLSASPFSSVPALITRPPYPGNVWRGPQRVCLALGVVFVLVAVGVVDERLHGTSTTSKVSIVPIDDRRVAPAPDLATLNLVGDELMGLVAPSQRTSPAMAYDSRSDRVILFGGATTAGNLDDTWGYDFETNTWMNMEPAVKPPGRAYHAMAYDSGSDRVILFSGSSAVGPLNDTWAYDFGANEWTNMTPASSPAVGSNHDMAYDSQSDRVILFGVGDSANGL